MIMQTATSSLQLKWLIEIEQLKMHKTWQNLISLNQKKYYTESRSGQIIDLVEKLRVGWKNEKRLWSK